MKVNAVRTTKEFEPFTLQITFEKPVEVASLWAVLLTPGAQQVGIAQSTHFPVIRDLLVYAEHQPHVYTYLLSCALSEAMRDQGFFHDPAGE